MQQRIRFCKDVWTKYNKIVAILATTILNTEKFEKKMKNYYDGSTVMRKRDILKKNLAPNLCTHIGNQRLVGMHANPMINV